MIDYKLFLDIAVILFSTKFLGILIKRIGLPEIVGALIAGFILGPTVFGFVSANTVLDTLAEIGVIMIMFSAGMETNLKQIKETGKASFLITALGVIVPLGVGFVLAAAFNGGFNVSHDQLLTDLYYGVVLTATSVSITVATLKEMGKLTSKAGTSIVSAAILDDIIGLCVLSYALSLKNPDVDSLTVLLNIFLFFAFSIVFGILTNILFKYLSNRYPHNRRMSIFSLVYCFLMTFIAEKVFNVAGITGAFIAGVVISNQKTTEYVVSRIDISAYMLFAPLYFAMIGIKSYFGVLDMSLFWFGILYIIVGMLTKVIGCGAGAKISGFSAMTSLFIGIGMMPRAEVMLITIQKGIEGNFITNSFLPYALGLIVISSLLTPIFLKMTGKDIKVKPLLEKQSRENPARS
jgi:Kef-type K+ transport system membrane component KefB